MSTRSRFSIPSVLLVLVGLGATLSWTLTHTDAGTGVEASKVAGIQGAGTSSMWIQNLDTAQNATVVADFYNQRGGGPVTIVRPAIAPGAVAEIALKDENTLQNGAYASLIHSDREIGAVSRLWWGASGGAVMVNEAARDDEIIVPHTVKAHNGETSLITVHNLDTSAQANVRVSAFDGIAESPVVATNLSVGPGTSSTIDLGKDATFASVPDGFVGWARLVSSGPIAVNHIVDLARSAKGTYASNGIPASQAANTLVAPVVYISAPTDPLDGDGASPKLTSHVAVVSASDQPSEVSLSVYGYAGSCLNTRVIFAPLAVGPGAQWVKDISDAIEQLPAGCAASLTIESEGGPVIASVIHLAEDGSTAAAYEAMPIESAGQTLYLPRFNNQVSEPQHTTAFFIMNVGDADDRVRVELTDAAGTVLSDCGSDCEAQVPTGAGWLFWPPAASGIPVGTYGHARIVSDGEPIAAVALDVSLTGAVDITAYRALAPAGLDPATLKISSFPINLSSGGSAGPTATLPPAVPIMPTLGTPGTPGAATPTPGGGPPIATVTGTPPQVPTPTAGALSISGFVRDDADPDGPGIAFAQLTITGCDASQVTVIADSHGAYARNLERPFGAGCPAWEYLVEAEGYMPHRETVAVVEVENRDFQLSRFPRVYLPRLELKR